MACFAYEALLLFGLSLVPGVIGTILFAQTRLQPPSQGENILRVFALLLYGAYFVWCWTKRGQTLAMQTWRIQLVTTAGTRLTQRRAMARYAACCAVWFGPAALFAAMADLPPWQGLATFAIGIAVYAALALLSPGRQFWHDRWCGTCLVDVRDAAAAADSLRPRPR